MIKFCFILNAIHVYCHRPISIDQLQSRDSRGPTFNWPLFDISEDTESEPNESLNKRSFVDPIRLYMHKRSGSIRSNPFILGDANLPKRSTPEESLQHLENEINSWLYGYDGYHSMP